MQHFVDEDVSAGAINIFLIFPGSTMLGLQAGMADDNSKDLPGTWPQYVEVVALTLLLAHVSPQ
jgi:hypothetical protein